MAKHTRSMTIAACSVLAASPWPALACHAGGDDDGGMDDADHDDEDESQARRECSEAWRALLERGCPAGSAPRIHEGDPVSVALVDDVAIPICDGLGVLIDADAAPGAQWVGYDFTQSPGCTLGCVVTYCQPGQDVCFGRSTHAACGARCGDDIDERSCRDFALGCSDLEPDEAACEDREPDDATRG